MSDSLDDCVWVVAPACIAKNSYCYCGEHVGERPHLGTMAVLLWNGASHRRVCYTHTRRHASRLDDFAQQFNRSTRRSPDYDSGKTEGFGFQVMQDGEVIRQIHDDRPLPEPEAIPELNTVEVETFVAKPITGEEAEALSRIAMRDEDGNLIASVYGAL